MNSNSDTPNCSNKDFRNIELTSTGETIEQRSMYLLQQLKDGNIPGALFLLANNKKEKMMHLLQDLLVFLLNAEGLRACGGHLPAYVITTRKFAYFLSALSFSHFWPFVSVAQSSQVILSYVMMARKSSSSRSSAEVTEASSDLLKRENRETSKSFNRTFWEISRYAMYSICMLFDEIKKSSFEAAIDKLLPRFKDHLQKLEAFRQMLYQCSTDDIDKLRVCS